MSDLGDLIAVGLLDEPNGLGLTANQAHAIGDRIAAHLPLGLAPDSLDAAWQEAEAALPEGSRIDDLHEVSRGLWRASAPDSRQWDIFEGYGPTPVAALRALAAKLREP